VRRAALAIAAILAAILLQVTVLNNLPFPGGSPPDLVLVVVVAMALASGPLDGAVIGFVAGLAVDIAPPASNLIGQSALAFCLVGYGCGRLRRTLERSALLPVAAVAVGAAAGEALYALVGLTFGDPDITLQSVRQVLPYVVVYDVLISPFVLYAVARLGGYAQWGAATAPARLLTGRELRPAGAGLLGVAGANGAIRDTGTGRSPRLRAAAAHRADAWIGGGRGNPGQAAAWVDRPRPLRLRLRGGVAGSAASGQQSQARSPRLLPAVHLRLAAPRRRDGVIATRRGVAGAAFGDRSAPALAGRSARLRGASLAGGPSALTRPGRARAHRTVRLKLGTRRHKGAAVGGARLASGTWPGGPSRGARIGRGTFGGASAPAVGRAGAAGFLARRQPGAAGALRSGRGSGATPRFRRPSTRFKRSATRLRGAAPKFRRSAARRWWPPGFRKGSMTIRVRGGPR
jgi:rod shape-determining protein MreD